MNPGASIQVFVYGTLMPGGRYHDEYCGSFDFSAQAARIRAQLYHLPRHGYPACVEPADTWVSGFLFHFTSDPGLVLARLDHLEGIDPALPASRHEYYRKQVEVYAPGTDERMANAWAYFMTPSKIEALKGNYVSSGRWTPPRD